jgi:hypothetical protein
VVGNQRLEAALRRAVSGEVRFDAGARAAYSADASNYRQVPIAREFKALWDPQSRMNPGKLIDPRRADQDLRLGPDYKPVTLATRFAFQSDAGAGFVRATEHCIGIAKCRSASGGTMCPSYRATREERFSTRGRARLLSEMLRGEVITDGWASSEVREALDWCLACKGCRSDCPTHTDMASYKAVHVAEVAALLLEGAG